MLVNHMTCFPSGASLARQVLLGGAEIWSEIENERERTLSPGELEEVSYHLSTSCWMRAVPSILYGCRVGKNLVT